MCELSRYACEGQNTTRSDENIINRCSYNPVYQPENGH
jgi:hypothetical protein